MEWFQCFNFLGVYAEKADFQADYVIHTQPESLINSYSCSSLINSYSCSSDWRSAWVTKWSVGVSDAHGWDTVAHSQTADVQVSSLQCFPHWGQGARAPGTSLPWYLPVQGTQSGHTSFYIYISLSFFLYIYISLVLSIYICEICKFLPYRVDFISVA